jgi:hypothetical protein
MKIKMQCQMVYSHGIAMSVHQPPFVDKEFSYHFDYNNVSGETIYVKTSDIPSFFQRNASSFKKPFVLVSGHDVLSVPEDIKNFHEYIQHPKLLHWYAQNYTGNSFSSKISHLPLGLDYHTLNSRDHKIWGTKMNNVEQERQLLQIKKMMIPIQKTISNMALVNFQHTTYGLPALREQRRKPILEILEQKKEMIRFLPKQKREDFWKEMRYYAFMISPPGYGLDTHRTWEILMLGRIPIIGDTGVNRVYEGLPIVVVKDWSILSKEWLEEQFQMIVNKWDSYQWERLKLDYWMRLLFRHRHEQSSIAL